MMSVDWDYDLAVGEIDHQLHTGLILAEDDALKTYLTGISVPDRAGMLPVDVWFRFPEGERRIKYPFITIDFLAITPSYDRWSSVHKVYADDASFEDPVTGQEIRKGMYIPSTSPELPELSSDGVNHDLEQYLMYVLTYQITVYTRSAIHDRYLMSRFMTDILPPRPFWIGVDADHTWRRCELVGMQPADSTETTESGNKRIFRKIYTITMDAELPQSRVTEIENVRRVHVDLYTTPVEHREPIQHLYDDTHTYADPLTVEPPSGS
jgi:hypothetical protein